MSRTIQIEVYEYSDLSPEAQKAAREEWSDTERQNGDEGACFWVEDHFQHHVGEAGYPTRDIRWRLSYCQGDGMAFYGSCDVGLALFDRVVREQFAEADQRRSITKKARALLEKEELSFALHISPNSFGSHYAHYNTMSVEVELVDCPDEHEEEMERMANALAGAIQEDVRALSRKLADEGYDLIDDFHEDDHVEEILINNEYEFTKDGSIWSEHFEKRVTT